MSVAAEIGLTSARELKRNLRSAKGLVALVLYLLGGAGAGLLMLAGLSRIGYEAADAAERTAAQRAALMRLYDGDTAVVDYLVGAPVLLLGLYGLMAFFLPLLTILLGYDQLAGEVQHRTIRYTAVRAHRASLVVGKAVALWVSGAVLTLIVAAVGSIGLIAAGRATAGAALGYGLHFWAAAIALGASYAGLTCLISSLVRTPVIALLLTVGTSMAVWVVKRIAASDFAPSWFAPVRYAIPGYWDDRLISPVVRDWGAGAGVCAAFAAVCVALACVILARRDV